ncbi:putative mitochondrial protein [Tanacetum coccineum]
MNGGRSSSAVKARAPSRGSSPSVKSRPSKNPPTEAVPTIHKSVPETNSKAAPKRASCSPSRGQVSNNGANNSAKTGITRSRGYSNGSEDVNPVLMGTKMVERVVNMRKLAPPKDDHVPNMNNTSGKLSVSQDNSGFGRSLSKKSFDMALRHLDIRRSMPGNMRAMITKVPASSVYSVRSESTKTQTISASDSPLATSSSTSSDHNSGKFVPYFIDRNLIHVLIMVATRAGGAESTTQTLDLAGSSAIQPGFANIQSSIDYQEKALVTEEVVELINNIDDDAQRIRLVPMHVFDNALNWHKQFIKRFGGNVSWEMYETEVKRRVDSVFEDPTVELKNPKQNHFNVDDIGLAVRMFKPTNLADVYCLAKMQEATIVVTKSISAALLATPKATGVEGYPTSYLEVDARETKEWGKNIADELCAMSVYVCPATFTQMKTEVAEDIQAVIEEFNLLNKSIVKDKFPIPVKEELSDELNGSKFFLKLDIRSGYHHIRMNENHEFLRKFVLVFFDDILIYDHSLEAHLSHLRQVLTVMKSNSLFAKKSKCVFAAASVEYLGHIISDKGVATDPSKILAMQEWHVPNTVKQLRGFLGLVIGAVLYQEGHPIAFLSKTLSPKHQTLSTYEKEFLAVLMALEKWRGGTENVVAGALSRISSGAELNALVLTSVNSDLLQQVKDKRKGKIIVGSSSQLKLSIIQHYHADAIGGHSGTVITFHRLEEIVVEAVDRTMQARIESLQMVKLQPHKHVTIRKEHQHKFSPKYYGPFMILKRIGTVAYRLELPPNSQVHLVFHVSQLKLCKGSSHKTGVLPHCGPNGLLIVEPIAILDKKLAT